MDDFDRSFEFFQNNDNAASSPMMMVGPFPASSASPAGNRNSDDTFDLSFMESDDVAMFRFSAAFSQQDVGEATVTVTTTTTTAATPRTDGGIIAEGAGATAVAAAGSAESRQRPPTDARMAVPATTVDDDDDDRHSNNNNNRLNNSNNKNDNFVEQQNSNNNTNRRRLVHVRIHEQVSALYDDFSQDGSIAVTGTIYLQTTLPSLVLYLKNAKYIQRIEERDKVSKLVLVASGVGGGSTASGLTQAPDDFSQDGWTTTMTTRALKVDLPPPALGMMSPAAPTEIPVANFYCIAKARPVPLLVKRKINVLPGFVRVGFKVRTNPHNTSSLQSLYIVMAVPPQVEGEKCKMSIKGGSWNEMKRTLTWLVKELAPGKALEVQAQFPTLGTNHGEDADDTDTDNDVVGAAAATTTTTTKVNGAFAPAGVLFTTPKFPILVKAIYHGLYSELIAECAEAGCEMKVRSTGCLLHRKV